MRMGACADRVVATELLSTGVGATKAVAPPTRSAAVNAVMRAMLCFSRSANTEEVDYRSAGGSRLTKHASSETGIGDGARQDSVLAASGCVHEPGL